MLSVENTTNYQDVGDMRDGLALDPGSFNSSCSEEGE